MVLILASLKLHRTLISFGKLFEKSTTVTDKFYLQVKMHLTRYLICQFWALPIWAPNKKYAVKNMDKLMGYNYLIE